MRPLLALLAGCIGPVDAPITSGPADTPAPEPTPSTPSIAPTGSADPIVAIGEAPALDAPDDWIFDPYFVHTVSFDIEPEALASLLVEPYVYVRADVLIDGIRVSDVGVRVKGKIGTFRDLQTQKASFKIDFQEFVDDGEFYGLEKLNLNADVVDCSHLKTTIGYRVFALAGIPSLRTGFAEVDVNGEPYGLYTLVENPDDEWLRRVHPDHPDGNLYDGKYIWYGGWSYTLLDFDATVHDLYVLEEGVDVARADIHAVTAAVDLTGTPDFYPQSDLVVDWDQVHTYLAVEQWIGHNDGYAMNQNNNFPYFDPSDGRMELNPWDLDNGFLEDWMWGMSWSAPRGRLAGACWADEACRRDQQLAMSDLLDVLDAVDLVAENDAIATVIAPYAEDDERRECASWDPDMLHVWLDTRSDAMRTFWGL